MPKCSKCANGTIYPDCPRCQGACQVIGYDDDGNEILIDCPRCGGAGTVPDACPVCHGTGEV